MTEKATGWRKREIMDMARESGFAMDVSTDPNSPPSWRAAGHNDSFEAFAALVDAKATAREREACAKVCEETEVVQTTYCMTLHDEGAETLRNAAAAIRARGQA